MISSDKIFSLSLRFHPDIVDLTGIEYLNHCYVKLLGRGPEVSYTSIDLPFDERVRLLTDGMMSLEFGGFIPLSDVQISKICQVLGWDAYNSAVYYALRYMSSTSPSYAHFVENVGISLNNNKVSRNDINHVLDQFPDRSLLRTLMDGLVDLSAQLGMAKVEIDATKIRLSNLERRFLIRLDGNEKCDDDVSTYALPDGGSKQTQRRKRAAPN